MNLRKRSSQTLIATVGLVLLLVLTPLVGASEAPTLWTDKADYAPGETVTIFGAGFAPGPITLTVTRPDGEVNNIPDVLADEYGAFTATYPLNGIEGTYLAIATDSEGQTAQTTFTDGTKVGSVSVGTQSPSPVTAGNSATYTVTVNRGTSGGSSGAFTADLSVTTTLPSGATASFSPNPVSFTPSENSKNATLTISTSGTTPAGTHGFTVRATKSDAAGDWAEGTGTLNVQAACTAPSITAHPSSATKVVGQSVTFSVTASGTGPLSYQWRKNGSTISGATSSDYTIASVVVGDAGSYDVVVSNGCGTVTSNAATLTVNKADQSISVTTHAPANAVYNTTFNVAATAISGLPVSFSSSGVCSNVGATFTMTSGTGTCTVHYNQAGNDNYNPAPEVTEDVTAVKADTTTTITSDQPDPSLLGQSYTVAWTVTVNPPSSGTPTGTVTVNDGNGNSCSALVAAGSCSLASTTVGTKTLTATYSGDSNFNGSQDIEAHEVHYVFLGFFPPIDMYPVVNTVKGGSTVPVKWRLLDANGGYITDVGVVTSGYPKMLSIDCNDILGLPSDGVETTATGGTSLRYDFTSMQFIYNWQTPKKPGTCWRLDVKFIDDVTKIAYFKLK